MTIVIILTLMILLLLVGTCMFWLRHSVICPNCCFQSVKDIKFESNSRQVASVSEVLP